MLHTMEYNECDSTLSGVPAAPLPFLVSLSRLSFAICYLAYAHTAAKQDLHFLLHTLRAFFEFHLYNIMENNNDKGCDAE